MRLTPPAFFAYCYAVWLQEVHRVEQQVYLAVSPVLQTSWGRS